MVFAGIGNLDETVESAGERLALVVLIPRSLLNELEQHPKVSTAYLHGTDQALDRFLYLAGSWKRDDVSECST